LIRQQMPGIRIHGGLIHDSALLDGPARRGILGNP